MVPSQGVRQAAREILDEQRRILERFVQLDYKLRELFWSSGMYQNFETGEGEE